MAEAAREHATLLTELMAGIDLDELWRALAADLEQAIQLGVESGRFVASGIPATVAAVAGASLGVMKSTLEGSLPDNGNSPLTQQILHVLGLPTEEAHETEFAPLLR